MGEKGGGERRESGGGVEGVAAVELEMVEGKMVKVEQE